jgi:hypothetical protein
VYLTTCLRGWGTKAAKRAMRASGARSTDDVPSDQGRLNSNLTFPSSRIFRRSLARGGRKMYLHRFSRPFLSLAATLVASLKVEASMLAA